MWFIEEHWVNKCVMNVSFKSIVYSRCHIVHSVFLILNTKQNKKYTSQHPATMWCQVFCTFQSFIFMKLTNCTAILFVPFYSFGLHKSEVTLNILLQVDHLKCM